VRPLQSSAEVAEIGIEAMDEAVSRGSPTAITQVLGGIVGSINMVDCTGYDATRCALYNRVQCQATALTCGSCAEGYFGTGGDANFMCSSTARANQLNATGLSCSSQDSAPTVCVMICLRRDVKTTVLEGRMGCASL
jgi:hypothetical protein